MKWHHICLSLNKLYLFSFAQYCRSAQPISKTEFQKIFAWLSAQPTNDAKQERCNEVIGKHCWTSSQVKSSAKLFTEDTYRITFGKAIYPFTYDQVNFIDVYDAFASMSNAIRLYANHIKFFVWKVFSRHENALWKVQ